MGNAILDKVVAAEKKAVVEKENKKLLDAEKILLVDSVGISALTTEMPSGDYIRIEEFSELVFCRVNEPYRVQKHVVLEDAYVGVEGCPVTYPFLFMLPFLNFARDMGASVVYHFPKAFAPLVIQAIDRHNRFLFCVVAPYKSNVFSKKTNRRR